MYSDPNRTRDPNSDPDPNPNSGLVELDESFGAQVDGFVFIRPAYGDFEQQHGCPVQAPM